MTETQESSKVVKATSKTEAKVVKSAATKATPATNTKATGPKKMNKDEMLQKHQQMVQFVQNLL